MTPKQEYEARKAERLKERAKEKPTDDPDKLEFMDMADRFITAVERIADALEVGNHLKGKLLI